MSIGNFFQDPAAILDYRVDWTDWLDGDVITSGTFSATPTAPVVIASQSTGTAIGTVWISNGIVGTTYEINHHISTLGGRTDERTFSIAIVNQ